MRGFKAISEHPLGVVVWVQRQDEDAVAALAEEHPTTIYFAEEVD